MTPLLPPSDLYRRAPEVVSLPPGAALYRFYTAKYEPIHFDRSDTGRFNAPDGSYGVLYAAENPAGAFAETFLRNPGHTLIDTGFLARKAYIRLEATSPMRLVRMAGPGLAVIGATAEVPHASLPYDVPQAWSKALATHPGHFDGIAYRARHDDAELCYALFDRARNAVTEVDRSTSLDEDWFWRIARTYGVGLAP